MRFALIPVLTIVLLTLSSKMMADNVPPFSGAFAQQLSHQLLAANSASESSRDFVTKRRAPAVSRKQVASLVRKQYANHRILNIVLIESKGPPVYKVKTLSSDGVVKYVYVDAVGGDVFD